jgi:hypothetical protein
MCIEVNFLSSQLKAALFMFRHIQNAIGGVGEESKATTE